MVAIARLVTQGQGVSLLPCDYGAEVSLGKLEIPHTEPAIGGRGVHLAFDRAEADRFRVRRDRFLSPVAAQRIGDPPMLCLSSHPQAYPWCNTS